MNILIVYTHPLEKCFSRLVLERTQDALQNIGHQIKTADLYAENFQPAMLKEDFAQFELKPLPAEIIAEQERVEWSDGLVFIFPIWWWSVPGMLKGWIDRVMSYGWAWMDPSDPSSGTLQERPILVMAAAGASAQAFAKRKYDQALETQLNVGTWDYCGFRDVTTRIFHDLHDASPKSLGDSYLEEVPGLCVSTFGKQ